MKDRGKAAIMLHLWPQVSALLRPAARKDCGRGHPTGRETTGDRHRGPIAPGPQRASDGALDRRSGAGGGTLKHARRTGLILVALPETPPVSEAASLQQDLRRAQIEPWAWGINRAMARTGTTDPLL